MPTISIIPENAASGEIIWRAIAKEKEAVGKTAGEALDAITSLLDNEENSAFIVVPKVMKPDKFFTMDTV
jgi:hypothetical protein